MKKKLKIWVEAIRPRTLPVSVSGVVIALALAYCHGRLQWVPAVICLIFAVLAQIVSNLANEYYDFLRGVDKAGRAGFRRGVTEGDISPNTLKRVTFATLIVTMAIGCGLIPYGGWWLVAVGALIGIGALAYSTGPYPLSHHALGEPAVMVFYGLIPVNFTYYVVEGNFGAMAMLASISIGFMGVNVLLVNNYRDVDDDREAGKRTSVVVFGKQAAALAYLINGFVAMAMMSPLWLMMLINKQYPAWGIAVPIVYLAMHIATWAKMRTSEGAALNPLLGATARNMLIFTLLLSLVLVFAV